MAHCAYLETEMIIRFVGGGIIEGGRGRDYPQRAAMDGVNPTMGNSIMSFFFQTIKMKMCAWETDEGMSRTSIP